MSITAYRFIEPLDVLFLRGNKLFGDPGSFGESLVPPWPSVVAGAIRSRMLVDDGVDLSAFARCAERHPTLGTAEDPGDFTLEIFHLARRRGEEVEMLVAPPADLVIGVEDNGDRPALRVLRPTQVHAAMASSYPLPYLPVLAEKTRSKPVSGYWLTQEGWTRYLHGELPAVNDLIPSQQLWRIDIRTGVGLNAVTRSAEHGQLFSMQAVAMVKRGNVIRVAEGAERGIQADYDVGFLIGVKGARPPKAGLLRLGGDGRAATIAPAPAINLAVADYEAICKAGRCRLVLTTPGLFPQGWKLPGTDEYNRVTLPGVSGRLVSATVPRAEVISGWDLAKRQPKLAQRAAPAGSVYWLDDLQATPEGLHKLAESGLWGDPCEDVVRRAEGFNRVAIAAWH